MMDLKRILLASIGVVVLSLYYFPVTLAVFPVANTKNLMAAVGLVVAVLEFSRKRTTFIDRDLFNVMILATLVSLVGLLSVTLNGTYDYNYSDYIISFIIWMSSAFFAVSVIKWLHGRLSISIVCNYLIVLCVLQCVSVLLIDTYPGVKSFALNNFLDLAGIEAIERKYGFGPFLDVAGIRFGIVMLIIAHLLTKKSVTGSTKAITAYIIAFLFILVVGSIVGRTTSVGGGVGLAYLLWYNRASILSPKNRKFVFLFLMMAIAGVMISVYYYNNNAAFKENVRFAFEGFFNWWEKGEWQTTSTDRWQTMFIWPDNMKTWVIGDGYFDGPSDTDPYYVGPTNTGFYKWTDVGYLRFIFYFGVVGLVLFSIYFCKVAATCVSRYKEHRALFLLILFFNFVVWFKVSTDVFLIFALFLCVGKEANEEYEERLTINDER